MWHNFSLSTHTHTLYTQYIVRVCINCETLHRYMRRTKVTLHFQGTDTVSSIYIVSILLSPQLRHNEQVQAYTAIYTRICLWDTAVCSRLLNWIWFVRLQNYWLWMDSPANLPNVCHLCNLSYFYGVRHWWTKILFKFN